MKYHFLLKKLAEIGGEKVPEPAQPQQSGGVGSKLEEALLKVLAFLFTQKINLKNARIRV